MEFKCTQPVNSLATVAGYGAYNVLPPLAQATALVRLAAVTLIAYNRANEQLEDQAQDTGFKASLQEEASSAFGGTGRVAKFASRTAGTLADLVNVVDNVGREAVEQAEQAAGTKPSNEQLTYHLIRSLTEWIPLLGTLFWTVHDLYNAKNGKVDIFKWDELEDKMWNNTFG